MPLKYIHDTAHEFLAYFKEHKPFVHLEIPYYGQWESVEMINDILAHKVRASSDKKWKKSGALSAKEYEYWSWHICGMACLKMILAHRKQLNIPTIALAKKCAEYGGYIPEENDIKGLIYKPFCTFVRQEFHLKAEYAKILSLKRIKVTLSKGKKYIIASVNPGIRELDKPKSTIIGGHLILITGYDETKKMVYFHNPSGISKSTQINAAVSESQFNRYFAKRGLIIG